MNKSKFNSYKSFYINYLLDTYTKAKLVEIHGILYAKSFSENKTIEQIAL